MLTYNYGRVRRRLMLGLILTGPLASIATATEGGGTVYPVGAETVLQGTTPAPGTSVLANFDLFYEANGVANSQGHNDVAGFHLRVGAVAWKFQHNWGVHLLGGTLVSMAALPEEYVHLDDAFASGDRTGFSNAILEPAAIAYARGDWHWWYGLDYYAPAFSYNKNDLVNVGQNNQAVAPAGAFSYLPSYGLEISSKLQYIMNGQNGQTLYTSGDEFIGEYAAMQNITKKVAIGVNGFYYDQTTDDLQNSVIVGDGNKGRDLAVGPQIRVALRRVVLIAKYQKDTLVRNRTMGNGFWFELALPLGHEHE